MSEGPSAQEVFDSLDQERKGFLTFMQIQRLFQRQDGSCLGDESIRKIAESYKCVDNTVKKDQFTRMYNLYKDFPDTFFDTFDDNEVVYFQTQDFGHILNPNHETPINQNEHQDESEAESGNSVAIRMSEHEIKFEELDAEKIGFLSFNQLKQAFDFHEEVIEILIRKFAKSSDHPSSGINKEEFREMFRFVKGTKDWYCQCFADDKNYPQKLVQMLDISKNLAQILCQKFTLLDKLNHPSQKEDLELIIDDYILIDFWVNHYLHKVLKRRRVVSFKKIDFIMTSLGYAHINE